MLREAVHISLKLDMASYSAAIGCCGQGRQWEEALRLLLEMPQISLRLDVVSCSAAIIACERGGQWVQAV